MGSAYLPTDVAALYLLSYNLLLQKMNHTSNATNRVLFNPNAIKEFAMKMPEVSFICVKYKRLTVPQCTVINSKRVASLGILRLQVEDKCYFGCFIVTPSLQVII